MSAAQQPDPSTLDRDSVLRQHGANAALGLTSAEASSRLVVHGRNELRGKPTVPAWRRLLSQFLDPLIYLLFVAIAIALGAWALEGFDGWPLDAVVIAAIVLLNGVLGFVQQARAADAVAALARMTAATSTVVRDGLTLRIPSAELVPGDMLVLAEGDAVGADARLINATSLRVLEASLTGESEAVLKDAAALATPVSLGDRIDMVFKGTSIAQGTGLAVVTATGMRTEMGAIAGMLDATVEAPTPLALEVARIGSHARHCRGNHRRNRGRNCSDGLRHPDGGGRGRSAASGGVARCGGCARRASGHLVGGAGDGRAAHGETQRHRQKPLFGRDVGCCIGHLH